jgi:hypothetical protein
MKKQQTPVVLIALLVVFGGTMIAMRQRPTDAAPSEGPVKTDVTGEAREAVSAKDLSATLKKQTSPKQTAIADPTGEAPVSTEAAILLPDYGDYKPIQNTTAATNQWYKGGSTKEQN